MIKGFLLLFTFLTSFSFASPAYKDYTISGKPRRFLMVKGAYVSEACSKKTGCMAVEKLLSFKKAPPQKKGLLMSRASRICKQMKGMSVFGVDANKNMMAFCVFPDESMIEYKSLESFKLNKDE